MMRTITFISFILLTSTIYSQATTMEEHEATLEKLLTELRAAENNKDKATKNEAFKEALENVLSLESSFNYKFPNLKTLGIIDSPDKQMRIVNWNVEQDDFSQKYYCYVAHIDKRRKTYHLTELKDMSFGMPSFPKEIITSDQWYGALYYKIIPVKKGSKTIYTVLGWDHNSSMSQVKLIDAIYFTGKTVKLGSPIFKVGKETHKRIFYEHSKKATMYLNYEVDRDRIMMDHLSPESPSMANFRSFYVPDLSYDAFIFKSGKWTLKEDVIGVNDEEQLKKQVVYVKNEKTGKVERKVIKTKWENPEDAGAPAGGSEHVAVTPETDKKENVDPNTPKINKKDKRDESELSIFKDVKKKKKRRRKRFKSN